MQHRRPPLPRTREPALSEAEKMGHLRWEWRTQTSLWWASRPAGVSVYVLEIPKSLVVLQSGVRCRFRLPGNRGQAKLPFQQVFCFARRQFCWDRKNSSRRHPTAKPRLSSSQALDGHGPTLLPSDTELHKRFSSHCAPGAVSTFLILVKIKETGAQNRLFRL
jgi:hypothetical protein